MNINISAKASVNIKDIYVKDPITNFENYLIHYKKPEKSSFFLIHHLAPHPPFIYTADCEHKINHSNIATLSNISNI